MDNTALTEHIEHLQNSLDVLQSVIDTTPYAARKKRAYERWKIVNGFKQHAISLLPKEREDLENAFENGFN